MKNFLSSVLEEAFKAESKVQEGKKKKIEY